MPDLENFLNLDTQGCMIPPGTAAKVPTQSTLWGILNEEQLKQAVSEARHQGQRIVMTNGCFDILHAGHVHYLAQARQLGDRLIVAINSDASVQKLKGAHRPINPLSQRLQVLAALRAVDWVVPFTEETPERLITLLLPDVLVKGGDYQPDAIAGAAAVQKAGGMVQILDFIPSCSTSAIIRSLRHGSC
jgi:D-beta-D-heptose 7-phosphate kinase/D-beta-D-heptose 1-phosphate adenosyltransferase